MQEVSPSFETTITIDTAHFREILCSILKTTGDYAFVEAVHSFCINSISSMSVQDLVSAYLMVIIIEEICAVSIYHIQWERRARHNSTNNMHTPTHTQSL